MSGLCAGVAESRDSLREHELDAHGQASAAQRLCMTSRLPQMPSRTALSLSACASEACPAGWEELNHQRGAARSLAGFAASLAHEVKNPLSGIRGAAQLLETAVADTEDKDLAHS